MSPGPLPPSCGWTRTRSAAPATGHIVPYWANRLEKDNLTAYQASPRGGTLYCRLAGDRVVLAGRAALFSQGEILADP